MNKYDVVAIIFIVLAGAVLLGVSIAITMGLVYGACWCFGWTYSHKVALGVWFLSVLIGGAVKGGGKRE